MNTDVSFTLAEILFKQKNPEQLEPFLMGLLTYRELEMLNTRIEIIRMLRLGWSQRAIVRELDVGSNTVTRMAKEFRSGRFSHFEG